MFIFNKGISGGICHFVFRYVLPDKWYMKHDENKDSSYTMYLDNDNLYGKAMSEKNCHFKPFFEQNICYTKQKPTT